MMTVMAQAGRAREDMLASALALLRERGYSGASFSELIASSGAPRGSIYHYFPGGKEQLAREALAIAKRVGEALIDQAQGDPLKAVDLFADIWRRGLETSDFRSGCPVAGVVTGLADDQPELLDAADECFESWRKRFAALLVDQGLTKADARRKATLTVAAIEGAILLCRASRGSRPLDDTAAELRQSISAALNQRPARGARPR